MEDKKNSKIALYHYLMDKQKAVKATFNLPYHNAIIITQQESPNVIDWCFYIV